MFIWRSSIRSVSKTSIVPPPQFGVGAFLPPPAARLHQLVRQQPEQHALWAMVLEARALEPLHDILLAIGRMFPPAASESGWPNSARLSASVLPRRPSSSSPWARQ